MVSTPPKLMMIRKVSLFTLLTALTLMVGCIPFGEVDLESTNDLTPFISLTDTAFPTKMVQITKTITPAPTQYTNTIMPTQLQFSSTITPYPTLNSEEAQLRTIELMDTNEGCKFPCFMGIEMGKTTVEEVNQIVSPIATTRFDYQISNQNEFIHMVDDFYSVTTFTFSNGVVTHINASYYKNSSIARILEDYGPPAEVWVWARYYFEDDRLMSIELFYPDQGIFVKYHFTFTLEDILPNGNTLACFDYFSDLDLWWPKLEHTVNYFQPTHTDPELSEYYISIDEALAIDRETFYEMYKGAEDEVCLEFPKEIWGGQGP